MNVLKRMLCSLAMGLALALSLGDALGADRLVLKGGKGTIEGEIVREVEGYVWFKTKIGGIEQQTMYGPDEIERIERDAGAKAADAGPTDAASAPDATPAPVAPSSGRVPKAAVLTLGGYNDDDMVGVFMVASVLKEAVPMLERELGTDKTGVVVLHFHSGGGLGLEVQRISDVIENEYKPRWRTVGWIDSAISAAAMSAHCLEEIYFKSNGNYGACTGFYGSLDRPVEGRELEESLVQMERISGRGGHNVLIMRAMQIQQEVSATIDENGKVHFFNDSRSGDLVVNRPKEILTFNAVSAGKIKFSKGTADTIEDLTRAMGYQELEWVGQKVKGVKWPVSQAEKRQMDFRRQVKDDQERTQEYFRKFGMNVQAAQAEQERERRAPFVGRARDALTSIERMVKNNPNFSFLVFNMTEAQFKDWLKQQDKLLRDLLR